MQHRPRPQPQQPPQQPDNTPAPGHRPHAEPHDPAERMKDLTASPTALWRPLADGGERKRAWKPRVRRTMGHFHLHTRPWDLTQDADGTPVFIGQLALRHLLLEPGRLVTLPRTKPNTKPRAKPRAGAAAGASSDA